MTDTSGITIENCPGLSMWFHEKGRLGRTHEDSIASMPM